jgi:hypothetical protein
MIADACEKALMPAEPRIAQMQSRRSALAKREAATTQITSTSSGMFSVSRNVQATGECLSPHRAISRS